MTQPTATAPDCASTDEMLDKEREQIRARRLGALPDNPAALDDPLLGLAFSGGGIRSATLNLGILQGLAKRGLLPYIDYLSTVSGGGYIGTWLHGVIRNYGKGDPNKIVTYRRPDDAPHADPDHDPIAFLRKFSSYLAPDMGLFSEDFWVILIIWLRNLSLNLIILVTALAVAPLAAIGGGFLLQLVDNSSIGAAYGALVASLLCVTGAAFIAGKGINAVQRSTESNPNQKQKPRPFDRQIFASLATVLMLVASTLLVAFARPLMRADWRVLLAVCLWLAVLYGGMQIAGGYWNGGLSWPALIFAAIAAVATTAMLYFALGWISGWSGSGPQGMDVWLRVSFGPPLLMILWLNGVALHLGLIGLGFQDFSREWLSRLGAFFAISALAWATLYGLFIFGPYGAALLHNWSKTLTSATLVWIVTTVSGVLAGNSAKTSGKDPRKGNKVLSIIVAVAPTVFMIGFLLLLGIAIHALLWTWSASCVPCGQGYTQMYWQTLSAGQSWVAVLWLFGICVFVAAGMQWRVNINEFSLAHFYKNRLVRCYLGASRGAMRNPSGLTGFDPWDDLPIAKLLPASGYCGPYPIVNTTLNINRGTELAKKERKGTAFAFTPLYCGYDPPDYKEDARYSKHHPEMCPDGYRLTDGYSDPAGPLIGTCMGISGAAANPNWGTHTSAPMAFLLTVFDVRLGWWLGNTRFARQSKYPGPVFALWWLFQELFAQTETRSTFINLSDGGHFENLGIYELVRRRCPYIIVGDGEEDQNLTFESLGGAIRKCRIDFGVEIQIDPRLIRRVDGWSRTHAAVGTIHYPAKGADPEMQGQILYFKSSLTDDEPEDVEQYHSTHPSFPHETTANQFFTESQFESYRRLGLHIVEKSLGTVTPGEAGWQSRFFDAVCVDRD